MSNCFPIFGKLSAITSVHIIFKSFVQTHFSLMPISLTLFIFVSCFVLFCYVLFCFVFCDRVPLCSSGWPWAHFCSPGWAQTRTNPPASASWVLGLLAWATTLGFYFYFFIFCWTGDWTQSLPLARQTLILQSYFSSLLNFLKKQLYHKIHTPAGRGGARL